MDRSPQNGRSREMFPGNVYRSKQRNKEKLEVLPTEPETLDHIHAQWPTWLENLLSGVHYSSERNPVFFCVSCRKVVYENRHFEKAAYHHGHSQLRTYEHESFICVNSADIKVLGVDTKKIQQFRWSVPKTNSSLFVFLHNTFGYAYKPLSMAASWKNCAHCHSWLQSVRDWAQTRFCCLDCNFKFMKGVVSEQGSLLRRLISIPATPPSYNLTNGAVTTQGTDYNKSPRNILTNGKQCSGCNRHGVTSPRERSCRHTAAHSSHDSDVRVHEIAGDDDSSVFDTDAEELNLCHVDTALDQYHMLSRSRPDDSEPRQIMSELYSFLPDSEDEITSFRHSDSDSDLELGRSSKRHKRKCQLVQPLHVVVHRTPTDVFGTMVSTDKLTTFPARSSSSKRDRITYAEQNSESIGDGCYVGCQAADQYFRTGSELTEKFGAVVQDHSHPAGHALVEHIRGRREVDKIGLPEVLHEHQLDALLSLCEEIQSIHITKPHGSPGNLAEDVYNAGNRSFADSQPVKNPDGKKCIPIQPECMVRNTSSFRTALAAASCSSNVDGQWWHHKVSAVTMSDWDVEGEGMALERLGQTPKSLDDNVLRKANFLLRSFGTEFENNQPVRDDDDTSSRGSSSSSRKSGPELSIASPKVEFFKVDGSIDFTSLKQLMSTFDPKSWKSGARSPEQVPGTWSSSAV